MRLLRTTTLGVTLCATGLSLIAPQTPAASLPPEAAQRYVVLLEAGPFESSPRDAVLARTAARAEALTGAYGGSQVASLGALLPGYVVELSASQAAAWRSAPGVDSVSPDQLFHTADTQQNPTWNLDRIDQRRRPIDGQFNYPASAGEGTHVYVVDTGIDPGHADFAGRLGKGRNFVADHGPTGWADCDGHGTHVASTAVGRRFGVAKAARVHAVRVLGCDGFGRTSDVIRGLDWVAAHAQGRRAVVNLSLAGPIDDAMDQAVANLTARNIVTAVAAGNEGKPACEVSPAREPSVLTVGASNRSDVEAGFSNHGPCVDVVAPGVEIKGASAGTVRGVRTISGTSMASPHAAGVAAILRTAAPSLGAVQIANRVLRWSTPLALGGLRGTPDRLLFLTQRPARNFTPTPIPRVRCLDTTCGFDATSSFDDGPLTKYRWKLGDGRRSSEPVFSADYPNPGRYTVTLTVTDNQGRVASATVTAQAQRPPTCTDCTDFVGELRSSDETHNVWDQGFAWDGGELSGNLSGETGGDVDLVLQRADCANGCDFADFAEAPSGNQRESLAAQAPPGTYRWGVQSPGGPTRYHAQVEVPACVDCSLSTGTIAEGERQTWPAAGGVLLSSRAQAEGRLRALEAGDLDLTLQVFDPALDSWITVNESRGEGGHERVGAEVDAGRYRWEITAHRGSATYEFAFAFSTFGS